VALNYKLVTCLPTILREYDKVARQCAVEQLDYQRYSLRMAELELLDRERRATERRIRQAKFSELIHISTARLLLAVILPTLRSQGSCWRPSLELH
jgi:hypothetical protein